MAKMLYMQFVKNVHMATKSCRKGKVVYIVRVDKFGRIVIPKQIRDKLSCETFILELLEDGRIVLEPLDLDR